MNFLKRCMIQPGTKIDLEKIDPSETFGWSKGDAEHQTEKNLARIAELQDVMHAEQKHSVLLCLQAMDTGGKDGTVKVIGGAMNPAGVSVVSFKKPSDEEMKAVKADPVHGFLDRIKKQVPHKPGQVVIFNRSQYEDVGIVRVHKLVPEEIWGQRYDVINDFEDDLSKPSDEIPGGVHVLKFFLHISPEEQLQRLEDRLDDPDKHWKISESDFKERPFWHEYMKAFSDAISKCSTEEAPWFVIPANHKWMRDLVISQIVVDYLEGLEMKYPEPAVDAETIRKRYFDRRGELKAEFDVDAAPPEAPKDKHHHHPQP